MSIKIYTEYKLAELTELPRIPVHWHEERLKNNFFESKDLSITGDEEMLSVSHITGVSPRREKKVNMFMSESNIGQKICQPRDIAVNTMWAWMAALGVSSHYGIVSPAYGVYRPRNKELYNPKYLDWVLRLETYRVEYVRLSTGIQSSRLRLYPDKFLSIKFIVPPRKEQNQIVGYLDWKVSQINKLINVKRKQVMLLQEQKRTMIAAAMPKIGEQVRFRHMFSLVKGLNITKANLVDSGVPCVSYGQIHSKYGFEVIPEVHQLPFVEEGYLTSNPKALMQCGDFVFADTSEDIAGSGNFTYLNSQTSIFAGYHTIIARPNKAQNYRYLAYYFDSPQFRSQIQQQVNGVKVYSITRSILNRTVIIFPSIEEQEAIVKLLDIKCAKIIKLTEKIKTEISLLNEYRTRLISDVVTGKVDVRDAVVPEYEAVEETADDAPMENDEIEDAEEE